MAKVVRLFDQFDDDLSDEPIIAKKRGRRRERGFDRIRASEQLKCDDADMTGRFAEAGDALRFMRAGNATVTLRSKKTGTRFTYKLRESEDKMCLFVGLLSGPDNEANYSYLGRISRDIFWAGRKVPRDGDVSKDAPSSRAFAWSWQKLVRGEMPTELEIWHEGRCGRCGRKLTVPESIAHGFGPECAERM